MTEVINELVERYNTLPHDEVLLAALVEATRAAQATDPQEKRDALRSAVANAVAPDSPNADERGPILRLADGFTAGHLLLLRRLTIIGVQPSRSMTSEV
ncbi:hypothetical protein ABZX12_04335 [Kribbella sp. NPDC003505]|uniref:hypothetical protein n=1 Tax=Kribbella sp. NPDC003505 TaxID=3154448 RepID=UPI0033A17351